MHFSNIFEVTRANKFRSFVCLLLAGPRSWETFRIRKAPKVEHLLRRQIFFPAAESWNLSFLSASTEPILAVDCGGGGAVAESCSRPKLS